MTHTFLFEPGVWAGEGTFWRADGEPLSATGRIEIAHRDDCWLLSGSLKVKASPSVEFVTAYSITPPKSPTSSMKWTSENAALGKQSGTFSVVGRGILSVYSCSASGYHGAEHMAQLDTDSYRLTAILLLNEKRLSSWELELSRT